eukprot:760377-Pleurochrysis_carterae.AAC.4
MPQASGANSLPPRMRRTKDRSHRLWVGSRESICSRQTAGMALFLHTYAAVVVSSFLIFTLTQLEELGIVILVSLYSMSILECTSLLHIEWIAHHMFLILGSVSYTHLRAHETDSYL